MTDEQFIEKYPMMHKFDQFADDIQVINSFLDWLEFDENIQLCRQGQHGTLPIHEANEYIINRHFEIDNLALERERSLLLRFIQESRNIKVDKPS
tara:strand:+ start:17030 stop:17314 length:285 start_codon:yes stop_codon:yes gene_type:complete